MASFFARRPARDTAQSSDLVGAYTARKGMQNAGRMSTGPKASRSGAYANRATATQMPRSPVMIKTRPMLKMFRGMLEARHVPDASLPRGWFPNVYSANVYGQQMVMHAHMGMAKGLYDTTASR